MTAPGDGRGGHVGIIGDRNDAKCSLNDATVTASPALWIGVRIAAEAEAEAEAEAVIVTCGTLKADP